MESLHALCVVVAVSGCSLSLDGPARTRGPDVPVCDSGKGLVAADGVVAVLTGLVALGVVEDAPDAALVLGLGTAAFIASAVRGNNVVNECRDAREQWARSTRIPPQRPLMVDVMEPAPRAVPPPLHMPAPEVPAPSPPTPPAMTTQAEGDEWAEFWKEVP